MFWRGELKRIAIAACHQRVAVCALLESDGGGEKVVGLEPRAFGVRKPAGGNEFGQDVQLLDQIRVELSSALICGKQFVAFRRRFQTVPADNDRARPLVRVETQQEICETEDGARGFAVATANGFWQGVVRSMRKGVAVDHQ